MQQPSTRSGVYVTQPAGYHAFVPAILPPNPSIEMDDEMLELLSGADRALGMLQGSTETLPNPDLFVMMYIRKEAVLSSQIEGTQASLANVLELEAEVLDPERPVDVAEVINYIKALDYGIDRLQTLPLSLRLIREIHAKLLDRARGHEKAPGEFRRTQNWIGVEGCNLKTASFVPPAPEDMQAALGDLEKFLHDERPMPFLIKVGLTHAQFETIHPFLDGNGRIGRLLITFLLHEREILKRPLLYLSYYFKQNRLEYYDRLQAVRDKGDWEAWLKFFLRGVALVANEATEISRKIITLREAERAQIIEKGGRTLGDALNLHEHLFEHPFVTVSGVRQLTGKEFPAASRFITFLVELGILKEITGRTRKRVFLHEKYFQIFNE